MATGSTPAGSAAKFFCTIDPTITGEILFDVAKLQQRQTFNRRCDEAFVSL
jgi:hypothetical protein